MLGRIIFAEKDNVMENNEIKKSKRVYKLKFDQLWVDAINQIPVCYHSEIYYWLDYYQNHNHSDLIGTIKADLVRSLFMLIYPTIRRRRLARERQRRYRARKKAARLAAMEQQAAASQSGSGQSEGSADSVMGQGLGEPVFNKKTPHGGHEAYSVGRPGNGGRFDRHEWEGS